MQGHMEVKKRSSMVKTMDYELWTTEIGLQTVTQGDMEVKKREFYSTNYGLRIWTMDCHTGGYGS